MQLAPLGIATDTRHHGGVDEVDATASREAAPRGTARAQQPIVHVTCDQSAHAPVGLGDAFERELKIPVAPVAARTTEILPPDVPRRVPEAERAVVRDQQKVLVIGAAREFDDALRRLLVGLDVIQLAIQLWAAQIAPTPGERSSADQSQSGSR